ncbi:Uncharacterized protein PBTT_04215 [Plasmodiophora brassicae]
MPIWTRVSVACDDMYARSGSNATVAGGNSMTIVDPPNANVPSSPPFRTVPPTGTVGICQTTWSRREGGSPWERLATTYNGADAGRPEVHVGDQAPGRVLQDRDHPVVEDGAVLRPAPPCVCVSDRTTRADDCAPANGPHPIRRH